MRSLKVQFSTEEAEIVVIAAATTAIKIQFQFQLFCLSKLMATKITFDIPQKFTINVWEFRFVGCFFLSPSSFSFTKDTPKIARFPKNSGNLMENSTLLDKHDSLLYISYDLGNTGIFGRCFFFLLFFLCVNGEFVC